MNKSEYSKKQIKEALIQLLIDIPLDKLSIKELVNKAQVSRNAFYNNYRSIEDVLKEIYREAHHSCFQGKLSNINYYTSDEAIHDYIAFFDDNTTLLLALFKWNLLPYIAKYNTKAVCDALEDCNNDFIQNHKMYFVLYYSSSYFSMCRYWIMKGKDISKEELFAVIKTIQNKDF